MLMINTKRNIKSYWGPHPLPETMISLGIISGELDDGRTVSGALFAANRHPYSRFFIGNAGTYAPLSVSEVMPALIAAIADVVSKEVSP